ncbi:FAD-dependent oxidoreductase [Mucilaginibacter gotjawali]|nr:FAD-dependent oxidoreductase [Mucilaginibacter gotjawali]
MIKKLILILLVFYFPSTYAQIIKTDVLVIGGSASGVAAAMQSARSKAKTVLAEEDSLSGTPILKKMMDSVKNLTVYTNSTFSGIKKENEFWEVKISENGKDKIIRARVVIDATPQGNVTSFAKATFSRLDSLLNKPGSGSYRTSIAMGGGLQWERNNGTSASDDDYPPFPIYTIPMKAVIANGTDNLLVAEALFPSSKHLRYLANKTTLGQGVGAVAAYCAFFKTSTKNLKVRIIQGEILDFKGALLPFFDIPETDHDWRAIQQVGATGLIKGESGDSGCDFMPDAPVMTERIKPVLTEIYSRAFLWFNKEKPGEKFTVANTLSLISDYTLTDPLVLNARIKSDWKTRYKFTLDFDINRSITRREFAVLINRYLNPFARTVDLNGNLVN